MRSYGQYCSVAKALDVVGDRWTLLIVRELLLQGPCRYTDLRNGLPGIATNLLADRLSELETAGLVRREEAAPPVATTLFHLTETGAGLEPALEALGSWGLRYMAEPADSDEFRSQWFTFPVGLFLHDAEPDGPPLSIELRPASRTASRPAVIEVSGGEVRTRLGSAASPDLILAGPPRLILGLLGAYFTFADAEALGLVITGDPAVLHRLQPAPATNQGLAGRPPPPGKMARSTATANGGKLTGW
ncbi:MAG TPA: helix-turn-helix domain-containing protein [Streptosporangiaceae bacterium]|nr:helix-turn-helix domain-containing protein [Streptosporangiaceae bacterium]